MQKNNHQKILKLSLIVVGLFFCGNFASAEALNLPKNSEGWTIFTPSDDSRIMYVSATGNDSTGAVYDEDDAILNGAPFTPGAIQPFATYATAYAHTREGYPDWVLLKRGDTFNEVIGNNTRSGRSDSEPSLIGAYGTSGLSPIMHVGQNTGYNPVFTQRWMALSGISFYAPTRDPGNANYTGTAGVAGMFIYAADPHYIQNVLIEGCRFIFTTGNGVQGNTVLNVEMRRCVILDSYAPYPEELTQGLFLGSVDGFILEENIFDHNGWYSQAGSGGVGQATMFNHNTYAYGMKNYTMSKNIFMRPGSHHNKFTADRTGGETLNVSVLNNLYIDGEIAIGMGGNDTATLRFTNSTISGNVITHMNLTHPTNRELAIAIEMQDWDGGLVSDNYIINTDEGNSSAINHFGTSRNVTIDNNIVYNFRKVWQGLGLVDQGRGTNISGFVVSNNKIQNPVEGGYSVEMDFDPTGKCTFSGNKYYSDRSDGTRFRYMLSDVTDAQWATATGDNSTFEQVTFPDPTRSTATYMTSIGETATLDAFYAKCRAQDRYSWDTRFMAETVNNYIKAGFATNDAVAPSAPANLSVL